MIGAAFAIAHMKAISSRAIAVTASRAVPTAMRPMPIVRCIHSARRTSSLSVHSRASRREAAPGFLRRDARALALVNDHRQAVRVEPVRHDPLVPDAGDSHRDNRSRACALRDHPSPVEVRARARARAA